MGNKITVPDIRARKGAAKISMVTAYDFPSASIADEAGIDVILVGDSVANVVHGFDTTLQVDVGIMALHVAAVARAKPAALLVADMPWLSYHISVEESVVNAGRLIRAGAEAVKIEGGAKRVEVIEALLAAEIPVMGHVGLTPQSVNAMGGYKVQGRELDDAHQVIKDAVALDAAGVFAIVLEGVSDAVADVITPRVAVPTIGIGAGAGTDGQVLVFHDVLGLGAGKHPKFVRQYADLRTEAVNALQRFVADIGSGAFPSEEETYHMNAAAAADFVSESSESLRSQP